MTPKLPTIRVDSEQEHARAQWWRQQVMRLPLREFANETGYTEQTIRLMEAGINSDGARVKPWVWRRYKMACAAVHAYHCGWQAWRTFDWQDDKIAGDHPRSPRSPA